MKNDSLDKEGDDYDMGGLDVAVGGKNPHNTVIVGKVYADWCGHCRNLKPEWARMKTKIHKNRGKKHIVYAEVEENEIGTKLRHIESRNKVQIAVNGYPTLFKIVGGKVDYYNGNRNSQQMADWYLEGGKEESNMPNVMKDVQGGRRRYFTRRRNRRRHNYRHRAYTRSHSHSHSYSTHNKNRVTKKQKPASKGIFGFLFGTQN
jgi:thiol-disulfide isomerase/thioredoxin